MGDSHSRSQHGTGPNLSSYPPDGEVSEDALLTGPHKTIPIVVSPNTRERSFSEIMNGAFNLEKSPKDLGKKLVEAAESYHKNRQAQNPFGPSPANRRDTAEEWSTPTRASKRNASSAIGPMTNKQAKSTHVSGIQVSGTDLDSAATLPSAAYQAEPVTVAFTMPRPTRCDQSPELMHLLELIRQNTERSKELFDMVEDYIKKHSSKEQEAAPVSEMQESLVAKDLISINTMLSP